MRKLLKILLFASLLLTYPARPIYAQERTCIGAQEHVSLPLTDLGADTYTRMDGQITEFTGGLYPDGLNARPPAHEQAGLALAAQITPRNSGGNPDPANGKIGMISIGMSNTSSEFNNFMSLIHQNPETNPALVLVNGAQGGRTSERWTDLEAETWAELKLRLDRANLTPEQVQVAWVKQTQTRGGEFPAKAQALQSDLEAIARNLLVHYPNLKIAYFSSRTRSYAYWRGLSPEPAAFETGFAVKWMIEKQINGDPGLNYDPGKGQVTAPYLSWGPYFWIDGANPRSDGRVWLPEDLAEDCTHPSPSGNQKVAAMLLEFFTTDSTATVWFLAGGAASQPAVPTSSPQPSETPLPTDPPPPIETSGPRPTGPPPAGQSPASPTVTLPFPAVVTSTPSLPPQSPEAAPSQFPGLVTGLLAGMALGLGAGWLLLRRR